MKTRILAALCILPLVPILIFWLPPIFAAIFIGLLGSVASYELLYRTGLMTHVRLNIYSAIMAFLVSIWSYFGCNYPAMLLAMLAFYGLIFGEIMISHVKLHIKDAFLCFLAGQIFPFMLTALVRIFVGTDGVYYIFIPFILAFMSDIGAYFAGVFFGKHKLCPIVSPKKTVEGFAGGILCATASMFLYGLILQFGFHREVSYWALAVYGAFGALSGVFGDLSLSVIKRQTGIKDYGNLIPGHGGVLDRFDSVLMTAPFTEALLLILPVVV